MAQFSVYVNPGASSARAPFLLDLQSDSLDFSTRVLAPLVKPGYFGVPIVRLNPVLNVNAEQVVLSPTEITAVLKRSLNAPIADLGKHRDEIIAALDMLFTGI